MPDARPTRGRPKTSCGGRVARQILLIVCATCCGAIAPSVASATSTSTNTLRQRAAVIAARISADDAALDTLGEQYLAARSSLAYSSNAARTTGRRVAEIEGVVTVDRAGATAAATEEYVDAGAATSLGSYLDFHPDSIQVGETYLGFLQGRIRDAIAQLNKEDELLHTTLARQSEEEDAAKSALAQATATRTVVLSTLSSEQHLYESIQGQIAVLVAEQLAAARAAAAAAAARAAAADSVSGPPSASASTSLPTGTLAEDFAALRSCESGGNYADNTGNGYYGAYQFALSTWEGLGGSGYPSTATKAAQDAAAYTLYRRDGWSSWPACAAIEGL